MGTWTSRSSRTPTRIYGGLVLNGTMYLGNAAGTTYGRLYVADGGTAAGA